MRENVIKVKLGVQHVLENVVHDLWIILAVLDVLFEHVSEETRSVFIGANKSDEIEEFGVHFDDGFLPKRHILHNQLNDVGKGSVLLLESLQLKSKDDFPQNIAQKSSGDVGEFHVILFLLDCLHEQIRHRNDRRENRPEPSAREDFRDFCSIIFPLVVFERCQMRADRIVAFVDV